jgi:hypothetical protein
MIEQQEADLEKSRQAPESRENENDKIEFIRWWSF